MWVNLSNSRCHLGEMLIISGTFCWAELKYQMCNFSEKLKKYIFWKGTLTEHSSRNYTRVQQRRKKILRIFWHTCNIWWDLSFSNLMSVSPISQRHDFSPLQMLLLRARCSPSRGQEAARPWPRRSQPRDRTDAVPGDLLHRLLLGCRGGWGGAHRTQDREGHLSYIWKIMEAGRRPGNSIYYFALRL